MSYGDAEKDDPLRGHAGSVVLSVHSEKEGTLHGELVTVLPQFCAAEETTSVRLHANILTDTATVDWG